MEPVSHQRVNDVFFVSLDPLRGLQKIVRHLQRYADLDLKLGEATRLLEERFDSLPADDRDILSALMWSYVRGRLKGSTSADAVTRWMSQGESVLPTVETSLETMFSPQSLQALVRETRQLIASESATAAGAAAEIQRARDELHQMTAGAVTEIIVPQLMALGLAALYLVVVEGYRVQQPPPPPPRPTGPDRPD